MKNIQKLEFYTGSKEELLPDFMPDFPYIASNAEIDKYNGAFVPWHWHRATEFFYMESGGLEYYTPKKKTLFSKGSGGFINSNVLHMTKAVSKTERNIQRLHIFDTSLISGINGGRIEKKYIMPITANPQIEIFAFYPDNPLHSDILNLIKEAFNLCENDFGYEIKIREAMTQIWLKLFELLPDSSDGNRKYDKNDERLKKILAYIHENFSEKIEISQLAEISFLSERECYRLFNSYLHTTPAKYIQNYRLREACRMLINGQETVTDIGHMCGLGDISYFGKIFREYQKCTPKEYREKWQNNHTLWQK